MTSQELVVRQPPQYGTFENTQEELDWYGSNPEGIDRDRTPEAMYPDEVLGFHFSFGNVIQFALERV